MAPTKIADVRVSDPTAIESRMPNSMPPYIPTSDPGTIVSNIPTNGARTSPKDEVDDRTDGHADQYGESTMSMPGETTPRTASVVVIPIRIPAR